MSISKDYNADTEIPRQLFGHGHSEQYPDHPPVRIVSEKEARKHKLKIKIELENRPQYIGGHGPPLTKLLLQPEHEKKNLMISDYIEKERGKAIYIVCSRKDHLKNREVSPEDILKWVSQRTLEEFSVREYERYEEIERMKEQKEKAEEYAAMYDSHGNPKSTRKKAVGRPRKSRQVSEDAEEDIFREVMPAKKNRAAQKMAMMVAEAQESEGDVEPSLSQHISFSQQPSLSHRPSLSQPMPNLKRKISQVTRESTSGESTDGNADEVLEATEVGRQSRKLSIRERPSTSLQGRRNISPEARERRTPFVEIPVMKSPFRKPASLSPFRQFSKSNNGIRKEPYALAATPVHGSSSGKSSRKQSSSSVSMPPPVSGRQTRIIPGNPKQVFSIFEGMQRQNLSSEPPRSLSKILPPERKKFPSSASKSSRK